ncbi:hypothetical protein GOV11_00645 [Candidatus Woesearchaeota archaeon]|nr:hypothetical protein [Candidatus Woesearchaeota archaeon]
MKDMPGPSVYRNTDDEAWRNIELLTCQPNSYYEKNNCDPNDYEEVGLRGVGISLGEAEGRIQYFGRNCEAITAVQRGSIPNYPNSLRDQERNLLCIVEGTGVRKKRLSLLQIMEERIEILEEGLDILQDHIGILGKLKGLL